MDKKKPAVFLGGECKDGKWQKELVKEFKDVLELINPYDPEWEANENIYDELSDMLNSDEIIFYKGGDGNKKEKEFLDSLNKDYEEFDDFGEIKDYLKTIKSALTLERAKQGLEDLKYITDIQCADGNWNHDQYMHGMANGLLLSIVTLEGGHFDPLAAPETYIEDLTEEEQDALVGELTQDKSFSKTSVNYKNGCIYAPVPDNLKTIILKDIASKIPEDVLKKDESNQLFGIETDTHIKLLFGAPTTEETITAIKEVFTSPIKIKSLDKIDYFDNDDATVAKVPIESEDLSELHSCLKEELPNKDTHPEYKPHITVAYLNPGSRLPNEDIKSFEWEITKLILSKKDGTTEDVYVDGYEPKTEPVKIINTIKRAFDSSSYSYDTTPQMFVNTREKQLGPLGDNFDYNNFEYYGEYTDHMEERLDEMMNTETFAKPEDNVSIKEKADDSEGVGRVSIENETKGKGYEDYITKTISAIKDLL